MIKIGNLNEIEKILCEIRKEKILELNKKRYVQLSKDTNPYLLGDVPIILHGRALTYDGKKNQVLAQIKLQNISDKIITSMKVKLVGYDETGVQIDQFEYQYLDLDFKENDIIGSQIPIYFNDNNVKKFDFIIIKIEFIDATFFQPKEFGITKIERIPVENRLTRELSEQYKRSLSCKKDSRCGDFVPFTYENRLWCCACGAINGIHKKICYACNIEYEKAVNLFDEKNLKKRLEQYKMDQEIAERKKINDNKRLRKYVVCAVLVLFSIVTLFAIGNKVYYDIFLPQKQYKQAISYAEVGKYDKAIKIFDELGTYKDSEKQIEKCQKQKRKQIEENDYNIAIDAFNEADYETALDLFMENDSYKDSCYFIGKCFVELESYENAIFYLNKVDKKSENLDEAKKEKKRCNYELGMINLTEGNIFSAQKQFANAGDYDNATELLSVIQEQIGKGWPGIYQRTDDETEYLELLCFINPDTMRVSYEAYFQNSIKEKSYIGGVLQDDGSLLLIDTCDNTLTSAKYDEQLINHSSHQFQPDLSVYESFGTKGFGGSSVSNSKIYLTISNSIITETYRYVGRNWKGETFDNNGTYQYNRISDCK